MQQNRKLFLRDFCIIVLVFTVSRFFLHLAGVEMEQNALLRYWQYLDVTTLQQNLLAGVWYDHTQPPLYNLILGILLKLFKTNAPFVFVGMLKALTLANTALLYQLLQKTARYRQLPLAVSLFYLLSPATMVFENELFYTTFVTFLLLTACHALTCFETRISWKNTFLFFTALLFICLTRSMYHVVWLGAVTLVLFFYYRKKIHSSRIVFSGLAAVLLTAIWYVKNLVVFGSFSASTWMGMNLSRNAFHDSEITDSSNIASLPPFLPISNYHSFLKNDPARFGGLNDRDLLQEYKNDSFTNVKHVSYLEVSALYMKSAQEHIRRKPVPFLKNVLQSAIIYFAPATRYSVTEFQARKIAGYDAAYSFNLSHFAQGKQERRIAMVVSALPKILLYGFAFFLLFLQVKSRKEISALQLFITLVIGYVFIVSSVFEHYENMRFRFEGEPLFLILFSQMFLSLIQRRRNRKPAQ